MNYIDHENCILRNPKANVQIKRAAIILHKNVELSVINICSNHNFFNNTNLLRESKEKHEDAK